MLDRAAYKKGGAVYISKITYQKNISKVLDNSGIL